MKKVLLDENLPRRLQSHFTNNLFVTSVPDLEWQSKKNGDLLSSMKGEGLAYLLTADRNLRFQQNLANYGITVVVLLTHDTRLKALAPHVSVIEKAILDLDKDEFVEIDLRPSKKTLIY